MSRKVIVLTVVAGTLVFLAVLLLYLPASWFASRLPPQIRCAQLGGSVWHGECVGLTVQGTALGDATWNLAPFAALTGTLSGDVELRGTLLSARADLALGFDAAGELRNVRAQFPMDPALNPQFPANQRGLVTAELSRVELAVGAQLRGVQGFVELRDFRQLQPRPLALGSYRLDFDGQPRADGTLPGTLKDLGGPFALQGTLIFRPPNGYAISGVISGRDGAAEQLVREITFGAPTDAAGRAPFSFEGTF